jgi:hypothetical protein
MKRLCVQHSHNHTYACFRTQHGIPLQARLYAAHTGDIALFHAAQDRVLCYETPGGAVVNAGGTDAGGDAVCAIRPADLLEGSGAAAVLGQVISETCTGSPFVTRDNPRRMVAAAKRLVQRFTATASVESLRIPLLPSPGSTPATICLADAVTGDLLFNTTLEFGASVGSGVLGAVDGWTTVRLDKAVGPGVFDLAITSAWLGRGVEAVPTGWPTRVKAVRGGGGARVETWGYEHADTGSPGSGMSGDHNEGCCAQKLAIGSALGSAIVCKRRRGREPRLFSQRRAVALVAYTALITRCKQE